MPIANVRKFIQLAMSDAELRKEINSAEDREARMALLQAKGLSFTDAEFGEGYRSLLVESQTEQAADQLKELKLWWELLQST